MSNQILGLSGIRAVLTDLGYPMTARQVERAANDRKIPVVVCPMTGKLVIRKSALIGWFDRTFPEIAQTLAGTLGTELAQGDSGPKCVPRNIKGLPRAARGAAGSQNRL